jgi:putative endonuclease
MTFYVYILQSQTTGRHYCGQTKNLELRLIEHNDPKYQGTKTTKRFSGPWNIVHSEECLSRKEAMSLERSIKQRGISRYLHGQ